MDLELVFGQEMHMNYTEFQAIKAGRVWVNQYHAYPAGAPLEDTNNLELVEKITK
jgi:acyl-CoA reductase-like NAD-dependent aldehyde dehydrogenase